MEAAKKKCPYCAEEILVAAVRCKHCRSDLPAAAPADCAEPEEDNRVEQSKTSKVAVLRPIIGILILTGLGLAFWSPSRKTLTATSATPVEMQVAVPSIQPAAEPIASTALSNAVPAESPSEPAPVTREIYRTSAAALFRDYEANEVATDEKIGNKMVEVRGTIAEIAKDFFEDPEIKLAAGEDEYAHVLTTLDKAQTTAAAKLSRGQEVTLRCDKMKRSISTPIGLDCTLIEAH